MRSIGRVKGLSEEDASRSGYEYGVIGAVVWAGAIGLAAAGMAAVCPLISDIGASCRTDITTYHHHLKTPDL
jgi:hypothetical protein